MKPKPDYSGLFWSGPWTAKDCSSQAKCEYCGRYGELGSCVSCGAPNRPVTRIETTTFGDRARTYIEVKQ